MICKIIGAQRKQGNFQGKDYDNVVIRVSFDCPPASIEQGVEFGSRVAEYKVKSNILPLDKAYEFFINGTLLEIYFDQYQNPVLFNPIKK